MAVPTAKLISRRFHNVPGKLRVGELFFDVPLDYAQPNAGRLRLFARSVEKLEVSATTSASAAGHAAHSHRPWLVYVSGGPGFGAGQPQDYGITNLILDKGYQILYFDHRGMGLSSPITADTVHLRAGSDAKHQASYLKHFRADSAVKDLEAIRQCLTADSTNESKKWSVMGQSYGGFVAVSYLSKFPEGLREVFTTGGLPPVKLKGPEEVYRRLMKKVEERNRAYYQKFPEDTERVERILDHLRKKEDTLPSGVKLTTERFMGMGISFGKHGGLDAVHGVVLRAINDLEVFGFLTRPTLSVVEAQGAFDDHPIYAVLHEAIYCQGGVASNWAADRVVMESRKKAHADSAAEGFYFTGEMVLRHVFEDYVELKRLAPAAEWLSQTTDWPELYDVPQLQRNEVPVYASTYVDDMYVDFDLAQETAGLIKGCKTFVTNAMYHDAPGKKAVELMGALFALKEDSID